MLTPAAPEALNPTEPDHVHDWELGDTRSPDLRIPLAEFRRLYDAGKVVVLDVRDPAMFERGHIKGARLAPMSALRDEVAALKQSGALVVTHCSCPEETSARAVFYLKKHGVTTAKALVGGYEAWAAAGGPIER